MMNEYRLDLRKEKDKLCIIRDEIRRVENDNIFGFLDIGCNQLICCIELESKITDAYFHSVSFHDIRQEQKTVFRDIQSQKYESSYANPGYSVKKFGIRKGQILSSIAYEFYKGIGYAYRGEGERLKELCVFHRDICDIFMEDGINSTDILGEKYREHRLISLLETERRRIYKETKNDFYNKILLESDLDDLRYLFKYGRYINDEEISFAEFMNQYSLQKIEKMAQTIVDAFLHGFISQNRKRRNRRKVKFEYQLGQEQLAARVAKKFQTYDMEVQVGEIGSVDHYGQYDYQAGRAENLGQFDFDHRFDDGLFYDKECAEKVLSAYREIVEDSEHSLREICGKVSILQFGNLPDSLVSKDEAVYLDKKQLEISAYNANEKKRIMNQYVSPSDISFCSVAFPNKYVNSNFGEIFNEFMEVNLMNGERYEIIQQDIIDALDTAEKILVKGGNGNETEIEIQMHKIRNPGKETNFLNCGGDLNIPHGETFTTPVLKGTNGLLHIKDIYLKGNRYIDLKFFFHNGMIEKYSCRNFADGKENEKYIYDTLLFPYESLPVGEFSIGTNTQLYAVVKKHNLLEKLPVLLAEKMGPHFAIGDPCYAWGEDHPVFNLLDGKEIVAKENEKSALRKTDINKAYTNVHIDITIPYDDIRLLSAISADGGKIDIIKNKQFVLTGTTGLNEPFKD